MLPRLLKRFTFESRPARRDRTRPSLKPRVECLEDRLAPATFTVNIFTDAHATNLTTGTVDNNGHISLRSALEASENVGSSTGSPNTINLPHGSYTLTLGDIPFGSSTDADVIIVGGSDEGSPQAADTTVTQNSGAGNNIFTIDPNGNGGSTVSISNLTLTGGNAGAFGGGAILDGGPISGPGTADQLTVTNCAFTNNTTANGTDPGGAIAFSPEGNLTVTGCTFTNNTAVDSTGGAIDFEPMGNAGVLTIAKSTFTGNEATHVTTTPEGGAVFVGGLFTSGSSITDSAFVNNSATGDGLGGAIADVGSSATLTLGFDRFVGNTAPGHGAAIFASGATVSAADNWWATNSNPANVTGLLFSDSGGTITSNPWLVLTNSANPSSIAVGATSTLTADFHHNSNGTDVSGSDTGNFAAFQGVAVTYGTPVDGTLSNKETTIGQTVAGEATATFTATQPGAGSSSVTVDGVTATANITITSNQATVSAVTLGWGSQTSGTLVDNGTTLLPSGRNNDIPWLNINKINITLSSAETLSSGDVSVTGVTVANYGPVTISGSGTSYTITLAQPIAKADKVTVTIGNANITTYTRLLYVLPGDVDDVGVVNAQSSAIVRTDYLNHTYNIFADIDGNGVVDLTDYTLVQQRLGQKKVS